MIESSQNNLFIFKNTAKQKATEDTIKKYLIKNKLDKANIEDKVPVNNHYVKLKSGYTNDQLIVNLTNDIKSSLVCFNSIRQREILSTLNQILDNNKLKKDKKCYKSAISIETEVIKKLLQLEKLIALEVYIAQNNKKDILSQIDNINANNYINNIYNYINKASFDNFNIEISVINYLTKKLFKAYLKLDEKSLIEALDSLNNEFLIFLRIRVDKKVNELIHDNISDIFKLQLIREKYLKEITSNKEYLKRTIKLLRENNLSKKKEKNPELVLK